MIKLSQLSHPTIDNDGGWSIVIYNEWSIHRQWGNKLPSAIKTCPYIYRPRTTFHSLQTGCPKDYANVRCGLCPSVPLSTVWWESISFASGSSLQSESEHRNSHRPHSRAPFTHRVQHGWTGGRIAPPIFWSFARNFLRPCLRASYDINETRCMLSAL